MRSRHHFTFLLILCCFQVFFTGETGAQNKPIKEGATFPAIIFKDILPDATRSYLGLSSKAGFSLKDFSGTAFLVEVFSTYCTSCPRNIPVLNDIYSAIEKDPRLKGKAKVFSIAVGNNETEVGHFSREYKVLFPVLTDLQFAAHEALGNPRVPFTILLRRSAKGNIVIKTHQGVLESEDDFLKSIRYIVCP